MPTKSTEDNALSPAKVRPFIFKKMTARWLAVVALCLFGSSAIGQETANSPKMVSTRFLPANALLMADLRPARILAKPMARFAPTEVMDAWCEENVGLLPGQVGFVRLVMPMPAGGGPPDLALVVAFNEDVSLDQIKPGLVNMDSPVDVADRRCFSLAGEPSMVIHAASKRLWFLGSERYLPSVFEASDGGSGKLAEIAATVPMRGDLQVLLDFEPVQPLAAMAIAQSVQNIPPFLAEVPPLINEVDAVWTSVDADSMDLFSYGDWTLRAKSDEAAEKIEDVLTRAVDDGTSQLLAMAKQQFNEPSKINDAWRKYFDRVTGEVKPLLRLRREGRLFRGPEIEPTTMMTTGVLVGLLLPAVQAAREAARRVTASNSLRQIGLAMHNYHDAYRKFPAAASTTADAKPLLSWRVAILPFIEQQELYEQFHLDEPWDSEHNLKLLDKMPDVYMDPSAPLQPGYTVFQLITGPETLYADPAKSPRFRDILDGTANTVLVVETSRENAVPWTKPADWKVDLQNPLVGTGDTHPGGFHVMLADGAIKFITNGIDPDLFRALVTPNGREVISDF
ncbi:MAG: DUF1559 domain-containing protein [Planctomycetota bacterium]